MRVWWWQSSELLSVKPTFFNILYTHPSFGKMPEWGNVRFGEDAPKMLPPINSKAGAGVSPIHRRATRVPWSSSAWDASVRAEAAFPSSPSKHAGPVPALPAASYLRKKTSSVSESTAPWLRLRPRTEQRASVFEALFGPRPLNKAEREKKLNDELFGTRPKPGEPLTMQPP